ncbi:glycine dehydrogenase (decarboxylating) alpha subunit [Thiogranum longum]|uniref:Probable glycine dehydrogenase (decarboxylating) subunit 1 n=1 Tax=Thiogranum longum TaxID=1537524 RepID=A0A4R1HBI7_9GAMM|nr:aminomethyl-transferring glycine dehydrogenase subunit GcvPA [Thiogranum longum]TCK19344.1 glycine dehydrogenase (decarboxylating) alpha subunit [Thiogranum longum]
MPFVPHTEDDIRDMLKTIGVQDIEDLFDEIPQQLRCGTLEGIPQGMTEQDVSRLMHERASKDGQPLCFIGAGAYEHHIPAAVWELVTRGEFYSAYTPYQAEASQGTLQLVYEFQSMMTELMAMDVSNASLYDGASALAEAVLMAIRANRKSKSRRILMPTNVHPAYRATTRTIVTNQGIELVEVPFDNEGGHLNLDSLEAYSGEDIAALVIAQPNFFGVLEDVDALTDWAHANGAMVIAVANPVAAALLKPPGQWGETGADIAIGEGQPLGVPLSSGGPYFGFMCARQNFVRQMPGRIVGRTVDRDGREGFTLTLQAREQHIRRSRATSNICTNQGLLVTAATIHMSLLGAEGLRRVALASHANTRKLVDKLANDHIRLRFNRPYFHEAVLTTELSLDGLVRPLYAHNLQPGYMLNDDYPELGESLLVCATETKSDADLDRFADHMARAIEKQTTAGHPVQPKMA